MEEGGTDVRAFLAFFCFWTTSDFTFSLPPIRKKEFLKAFNALSSWPNMACSQRHLHSRREPFHLISFRLLWQYQWLGGLSTFISPSFGGWEVQDQGTGRSGVWGGPASWPIAGSSQESSHGGRGKGALWGLLYKGTNPIHEGSTFTT